VYSNNLSEICDKSIMLCVFLILFFPFFFLFLCSSTDVPEMYLEEFSLLFSPSFPRGYRPPRAPFVIELNMWLCVSTSRKASIEPDSRLSPTTSESSYDFILYPRRDKIKAIVLCLFMAFDLKLFIAAENL